MYSSLPFYIFVKFGSNLAAFRRNQAELIQETKSEISVVAFAELRYALADAAFAQNMQKNDGEHTQKTQKIDAVVSRAFSRRRLNDLFMLHDTPPGLIGRMMVKIIPQKKQYGNSRFDDYQYGSNRTSWAQALRRLEDSLLSDGK